MTLYYICLGLHLVAMALWLGHMFVWSLFIGPALKRVEPATTADLLRESSLFRGGLGWPALIVLIPTGFYMLSVRGIQIGDLVSGAAFHGRPGNVLAIKLALVAVMIGYQVYFGHRRAPIAIYFDMLAALVIIAMSVLLVRGWI